MPHSSTGTGASPHELAEACGANARVLLDGAAAVAVRGHFGLARSLLVLAYEEEVLAQAYFMAEMNWASIGGRHGEEILVFEATEFRGHWLKQFLIFMLEGGLFQFALQLREEVSRGDDPGLRPKEAVEAVLAECTAPRLPTEHFNGWKNEGLYVDATEAGVRSPILVTQQQYETLKTRIETRLSFAKASRRTTLSPEQIAQVISNTARGSNTGLRIGRTFLQRFGEASRSGLWSEYWDQLWERMRSGEVRLDVPS